MFDESDEGYIRCNQLVGPKPQVYGFPMVVELTSNYGEAPPPDP